MCFIGPRKFSLLCGDTPPRAREYIYIDLEWIYIAQVVAVLYFFRDDLYTGESDSFSASFCLFSFFNATVTVYNTCCFLRNGGSSICAECKTHADIFKSLSLCLSRIIFRLIENAPCAGIYSSPPSRARAKYYKTVKRARTFKLASFKFHRLMQQ